MRMLTISKEVFTFDELSCRAKETARDWYREGLNFDTDFCFESFITAATLLGIDIPTRGNILYSGFSSQGDGASFIGDYSHAAGCSQAIRKEFPIDETLHRIADELAALQVGYRLLGGKGFTASITQSGSYCHSGTMNIEVDEDEKFSGQDEIALLELMRRFADWMYKSLEQEYDYQNSDETVDENIMANEYEFTEDGKRA